MHRVFDSLMTRNNTSGIGLGLTTAKYLSEASGGELKIKSQVQKGTKICFSVLVSNKAFKCESDEIKLNGIKPS